VRTRPKGAFTGVLESSAMAVKITGR
jgi:hypothetical protein